MPKGRQSTRPLVDRLLDGKLEEKFREMRAAGDSHGTIATRLANEHDIDIADETVRRWCNDLNID